MAVPASGALALDVAVSGPSVTLIEAVLYLGEPSDGTPRIERFPAGARRHEIRDVRPGPYRPSLRVEWAGLFDRGEESYIYRLNVRDRST